MFPSPSTPLLLPIPHPLPLQETEEAEAVGMDGRVPEWLEGRVTRNGPGMVQVGATHYDHLFDSLAMLHRFTIQRGRVTYCSRRVCSGGCKEKG